MASIADRVKAKAQEIAYTGRITRSRAASARQQPLRPQVLQKPQTSKRKRAIDDEDEDEDEDGDGDGGDNGNSKDKNQPPKKKRAKPRCKFCFRDPQGKEMNKDRYCDYFKIWKENFIECQNCADYRSQNPGNDHKCQPPNVLKVWRKYGVDDPPNYAPPTCDQCLHGKLANQCNVDSILGYGCTLTKACRDGGCTVNGRPLDLRPRPRVNVARWVRTECHVCENKTKKNTATAGCSWLRDRTAWNQACTYCQAHNLTCLSGGHVIANPPRLTLPSSWIVNQKVFDWGFIECRGINPDRRYCKRCREDGHDHCRADANSYAYACNRCAQFGVDCVDNEDDTHYPIFDLARIGIGGFMPFVECTSCTEAGRNCDLQRPCDSCVKHGDECDEWKGDTAKYCIRGRLDPPPGPLYYLALGYGVGGVDDPKDGSAIEHWVGPATNLYGMVRDRQRREVVSTLGVHLRAKMRPPGAPPHGDAAQGGLVLGRASTITRQQIVAWIRAYWPEAHPMNQFAQYQDCVDGAQEQIQSIRTGEAVTGLSLEFWDVDSDGSGIDDDVDVDDETHSNANNSNATSFGNNIRPRVVAIGAGGNRSLAPPVIVSTPASAPALHSSITVASVPTLPAPNPKSPEWLLHFLNESTLTNEVATPQFENPLLSEQGQFNFDFAAPSHRAVTDLHFSPFQALPIDPALDEMDIDMDMDQDQDHDQDQNKDKNLDQDQDQDQVKIKVKDKDLDQDQDLDMDRDLDRDTYSPLLFASYSPAAEADEAAAVDHNPPNQAQAQAQAIAAAPRVPGLDIIQGFNLSSSAESLIPIFFSFVLGQPTFNDVPFYNLLSRVPLEYQHFRVSNDWSCFEPRGDGRCGNPVSMDSICQCASHQGDFTHVCKACAQMSAQALARCVTDAQLFSMRAYLCTDCSTQISGDIDQVYRRRPIGAVNIWGELRNTWCADYEDKLAVDYGKVNFKGDAKPLTGCSCGSKLFTQHLCRNHRLGYGDALFRQVAMLQEWRIHHFGRPICPGCLVDKPAHEANLSLDFAGKSRERGPKAWACLACGDWVINQPHT
ncbi:zn2-c6 fungal-type dna-binding domain [Trichoderma arundinaceum]|uniref:Zn2-c6 fungal-type dna-binding domain n=1 Tax=Trichoderma arundinaceum TaxID=490622 RepID=A0A395N8E0_TRIAR|nr:zn2-c6 fungal-type dna-binding domain [Trichoderma arundinaceum]